jgi:hypothetical protein
MRIFPSSKPESACKYRNHSVYLTMKTRKQRY